MKHALSLLCRTLPLVAIAAGVPSSPKPATPSEIVAAAPSEAWRTIPADQLLMIDLDTGQRVTIALAPDFAPVHIANIRILAQQRWYDGTTINRVQDNYVTQWGDATEKKPLPAGIIAQPPAEYDRDGTRVRFRPLGYRDAYAPEAGHVDGWPAARDGARTWLVHCYGMVGVGRGLAPDTGTGAELYAVSGHAPRHLDRNMAVVGRVLGGMEALTALPRGTEQLGFYKEGAPRPQIVHARLASDLPKDQQPTWQILRTDTPTFTAWVTARANRKDDFFIRPAGSVDICNATPPVRTN
jgi:peptidylprolyl isomerase